MPRSETLKCLECDSDIEIEDIWEAVATTITCPSCNSEWYVYVDEDSDCNYWFGLEKELKL